MSETTESTPSSETPSSKGSCNRGDGRAANHGKRRGIRRFLFGALILGLLAIPAARALAGPGGMGCHRSFGSDNPAEVQENLGRGAEHLMDRVDGTEEQRAAVQGMTAKYAPELAELHAGKADLAERARSVLGAETVDRTALEEIRKEALEHISDASALAVEATVELSNILTLQQRQELLESWDHMRK